MKNGIKTLAMWLIIGVIFIVLLSSIMTNTNTKLKYSELIAKINEGKVESIVIDADGTSATVQLSDDKVKKQVLQLLLEEMKQRKQNSTNQNKD